MKKKVKKKIKKKKINIYTHIYIFLLYYNIRSVSFNKEDLIDQSFNFENLDFSMPNLKNL